MTGNNPIRFDTKRDFHAIGEVLKRTDLGNKEPGVVTVEPVVNVDDEIECEHWWWAGADYHSCTNAADVRVVRNRDYEWDAELQRRDGPTNIYSETWCIDCCQREVHQWVQDQLDEIFDGVEAARSDRPDDRRQRARGDD